MNSTWRPRGGEIVAPAGLIEIDELTGDGEPEDFSSEAWRAAACIAVRGHATDNEILLAASEAEKLASDPSFQGGVGLLGFESEPGC